MPVCEREIFHRALKGGIVIRKKRLNNKTRQWQYIKLIIMQCFLLYYVIATIFYLSPSTNAYFGDQTYASLQITNAANSEKDSSSLASVASWTECPNVYASFVNNGGDMLVDTNWSVYKQIKGNEWSLIQTIPLPALKSNETRVLSYKPIESGTYRFVVQQVPTHAGASQPKIETPSFDISKCQKE